MRIKFLLVLVYFDRPNMVRNALYSIRDLTYDNWELAFIDDGSQVSGEPIVADILEDSLDRITFYNTYDTIIDKMEMGESRHGELMNMAIMDSDADVVVIICDDDALFPEGLTALAKWYQDQSQEHYCYSHVAEYDPMRERPNPSITATRGQGSWLNRHNSRIQPSCQVDSSQVTYRREAFHKAGLRYDSLKTGAQDASMFSRLYDEYGPCPFSNVVLQYKGVFDDQLGKRSPERAFHPLDSDLPE